MSDAIFTNQGYVVLQDILPGYHDRIPAGYCIQGTPKGIYHNQVDAIQTLESYLERINQEILWIGKFNGMWVTYHTRHKAGGDIGHYFWFIYGGNDDTHPEA